MLKSDGPNDHQVCRWLSQSDTLRHFATYEGLTQSQKHIKPLHWYVACRLVVEGGFNPQDITPHPPFVASESRGKQILRFDPTVATGGEAAILGGLKTKDVDVVVSLPGIGPALAISCKGMTGAFRNLTNRMEETIGECTNLHITYPPLVLGYIFIIRANRATEMGVAEIFSEDMPPARQLAANDIAIREGGEPVESIIRFHNALRELTGRRGIRNDLSRYEAIALAMVDMTSQSAGSMFQDFPAPDSPLRLEHFFKTMYLRYDERFVYSAPDLKAVTQRREWSSESPALTPPLECHYLDYEPRLA